GIAAVMMLYNLFIFIVSRDKSYLYYCGFGLMAGMMVASFNGYAFAYLWPNASMWQHYCTVVLGSLATVFACLFVREFLQMHRHQRILDGVIKYLAILSLLETLVIPLFSVKFIFFLLGVTTIPIYLLFMYAGLKEWQRGDQAAIYFTLPWIIVGIAAIALILTSYNVFSSALFNRYGIAAATSIELVFLSLALAKRINQVRENAISTNRELREQQFKARLTQEKLLQLERKAKEELEQKVMERTRELNRALNQLSDTHARLQLMSTQDSLTGLKNRRYFDSALQNEWARAVRNKSILSLLVLDVDYFKNINDNHGHQIGDEVLIEIASIFSQELQHAADVVARFGGEEFIILLPQCNLHAAVALAERLRLAVQQLEIVTEKGLCKPTISIGVTSIQPTLQDSHTQFVAQADAALYEAKKSGRNRVCIASTLPPLAEAKSGA
ncbi:MAG TPA: diguanylate cyclase, partial [Pseudomonadales bacterium]|nr:diguanylate cyclase [Pseudomonadales bacterium]